MSDESDLQFDVTSSTDTELEYQVHDNNVFEDIVAYSRSKQLLNEEQTMLVSMVYMTGLLPDSQDYTGAIIRGGSGDGKSHLKMNVVDDMFMYAQDAHEWLYHTTGGSAKSLVDDEDLDDARVGAFDEMNKMPDELMEMLKSLHGDDGGFTYKRNVADPDKESGRRTVNISRDPLSFVFMLADENDMEVEQELETRLMDIKVDASPEKNRGVHRMNWGHKSLEMDSIDHNNEYIDDRPELWHAVRCHIRDIPVDTPVLIPTADNNYRGDTWDAAAVTQPLFDYEQSGSTRASNTMASLVKASALANYHARNSVGLEVDGEMVEHIVADPIDVANMIFCRNSLLALTHGLTDKKFALVDAIRENGAPTNTAGTEYGAEISQILAYVEESSQLETMKKREVKKLLDEMNEQYLIDKTDHPEDGRKNYYKYSPRDTIEPPNIGVCYDEFADLHDPIRDTTLEDTIQKQQAELGAEDTSITADAFMNGGEDTDSDSDSPHSGLEAFENMDDTSDMELSEIESAVCERLTETLDGTVIPQGIVEANTLKISHMIGATPVTRDEVDGGEEWVEPARPPTAEDKTDELYRGYDSLADAETAIEEAVASLQERGILQLEPCDSGMDVSVVRDD